MRSARFAIGGAAVVRGQRDLQESAGRSITRIITKTILGEVHHDRFRRKDDHS
jgi:hypothetical protein